MILAVVIGFGATGGMAQDKAAIIKQRQDTMKQQSEDLKAIVAYMKDEGDQATAQAKIADLIAIAPKIADLFPAGTSLTDFPGKTGAKPAIWTEFNKFKASAIALQDEEKKLAEAIKSGDKAAVTAAVGVTGKACGACHTPYREKI